MTTANPKDTTRLSAGHLSNKVQDDENWGDVPAPKASTPAPKTSESDLNTALNEADLTDDQLEQELANGVNVATTMTQTVPVKETPIQATPVQATPDPTPTAAAAANTRRQLEDMQKNVPALTAELEANLQVIAGKRAALDTEEAEIKNHINFLRRLSGQKPLDEEEAPASRPQRRGGRRKKSLAGLAAMPTPAPEGVNLSLKQAICKGMMSMNNYTGNIQEISKRAVVEGYRTKSKKEGDGIANTVRIQVYRLVDDKYIIKNADGAGNTTYTLTKLALDELNS